MKLPHRVALPVVFTCVVLAVSAPARQALPGLDRAAARWVDDTLKKMSLDDKVGQLVVTSAFSTYQATDSDAYQDLARRVTALRLGGVHFFGGREAAPPVLLNPTYSTVTLGQPFDLASLANRLQAASPIPLLNTADFEAGAGFRVFGATAFPRQMAIAAAGDEQMAFEAARATAEEARAMGVHVNFAPVADVNNNARNPVINTRAFGEDPAAVGRFTAASIRGLQAGGMLATAKHFPGHGDTDVDSHIGLPVIAHPRDRLEAVELAPFRAAIAAGVDAIMLAHIMLPALDAGEFSPATLSRAVVTDLLRGELGFGGLIYTDSMTMDAIARRLSPAEAAARAIAAGCDVVLHSPDDAAAVAGIKAAVERGEIPMAQIDASVRRILTAKARLGLHRTRTVSIDDVPARVGRRDHGALAQTISARSITLIQDDRGQVPLRVPRESSVLYLSVLDHPGNWRIGAPGRTLIPALRQRWPNLTAVELSDRSTTEEIELVRRMAARHDAIVAAVFVRTASGSGRMDLSAPLVKLLTDLERSTANTPKPLVGVFFGNPYVATSVPSLPAMLLTYDFYDLAEASAARALVGEAPIGGRLPIALPGLVDAGFGLMR